MNNRDQRAVFSLQKQKRGWVMSLGSLRVATRMQILVGLALLGLLVLCITALFQLKAAMLEDRKSKTKNLVETAMGILAHHHKLAQEGKLSDTDARQAAKESLRNLRYGTNDYYFITDTNHVYVLLPPKPENEGLNKKDLQDANGKYLIQEIVKAGLAGGGFIEYWFPRAGQTTAEPKLSYAAQFAPWGWVIGTGVYIDDIDTAFRKNATVLGAISAVLLVALALVGWQSSKSILDQLGGEPSTAQRIMQEVAQGNLAVAVASTARNSLLESLGTMAAALRTLVSEIDREADRLVKNAGEIRLASGEVAKAAENQADATSAMAAAIEELTVSSTHISDIARDTEADSRQTMDLAGEGRQRADQASTAIQTIASTVTQASDLIRRLEERANQISSIAGVIKEIAGQTNLLALNAAIEAARAGEQGRGFAVVADEVRKLAERTSMATTEIEQMIGAIQSDTVSAVEAMNEALPEVGTGVQLATSASESLHAIADGAGHTLERVRDVANATREQGMASTSIAQRVEEIAQMVEQTSAATGGTAEAAQRLEDIAQQLKQNVARFRV
jgi:methyl-accepting chemotaxis protein